VSPVAVWNAQNAWVSFAYQAQHGAGGAWRWQEVLRFVLVQLLACGPLLLWGAWARTRLGVMRWFFVLPFAVLAYLSGGGSSLPHWTAPAWVALAPFAGVALAASWRAGAGAGLRRALIGGLVALQALACAGLGGLMLSGGAPLLPRSLADTPVGANPFVDLYGWQAAGARARSLAAEQGLASVAVQNWTLASRLGWYARPLPVHVLEDRFDQFDIWAGDLAVGGDTLLVDWSAMAYTVPLGAHGFRDCALLETQDATHWGAPLARFRGVKRRQEVLVATPKLTVIEDFGHHPTALAETLISLANRYPGALLTAVFEPRSNTARTKTLQAGFMRALAHADEVFLGAVNRADKLAESERFDSEAVVQHLETQGVHAATAATNAEVLVKLREATLVSEGALAVKSRVVVFFSNGSFDGIIAAYATAAKAG
jgi:hypothetical protein